MSTYSPAKPSSVRSLIGVASAAILAIGLGGCQSASVADRNADPFSTSTLGQASLKDTAVSKKRWNEDRKNLRHGLAYARQLQALGETQQQLKVLDVLARHHPDDIRFQSYYGKQLAQSGQSSRAVQVLQRVVKSGKADWKTHSALGSALDQSGQHGQARPYYEAALKSRPNEVSILNNMGMSYLLEGNLRQAEVVLKRADASPASSSQPRIRQNLALAVGLQGRFDEARTIASRDLPPEQVEANMAFLKKMMSQNNTWQKLKPAGTG